MVVIQVDNEIRNVKLTIGEISLIIEELERQPHNVYEFLNYSKIIEKLRVSIDNKGK